MQLALSPELEAWRGEVQEFLRPYTDLDGYFQRGDEDALSAFYRELGARGWLSLTWPIELGGEAKSPLYEFVLWDEIGYARIARPPLAAGVVAKSLIAAGTADQHERFLPGIRAGELHFSLGYSEPEAGSDLAAVRCRAVRDGDEYVVTGEKRWTSHAQRSNYLWTLCRTGALEDRSRALTLLIIDLASPEITVSPIWTHDDYRLNEVRLDGVHVPVANRVGSENGAWTVIGQALAVERHMQFPPKRVRRDLEELRAFVHQSGIADDPVIQARMTDLAVRVAETDALTLQLLAQTAAGGDGVVEAADLKVAATVTCQAIARAALDLGASAALVRGTEMEYLWRQSLLETIGGGTSEILRSVIARNRLHLAASA